MKKKLSVYLPNGKWSDHKEGKGSVTSIRCLGSGLISVMYEYKYMDGECKVVKETVFSGMPFILEDV